MNNINVPTFISICIGSLSSLLGIIVSVLILGITLSEQTFGSRLKYVLLNESSFRNFFILCVFCIFIFIFVNFIYSGTVTNLIVNLTIYAVILYIISILSIYPLIKIFLFKSTSNKHIDKLLLNINFKIGENYLREKYNEENAFYILEGVGLQVINSNDRKNLEKILEGFFDYYCREIKNKNSLEANSIREISNIIMKIQSRWLSVVKPDSEEWVVLYFMKLYKKIREESTEKNFNHFNFVEYDFFIERCFKKVDPFVEISTSMQMQSVLVDIYTHNLKEFVPNEAITTLSSEFYKTNIETDDNFSNEQQWYFLNSDFIYKFNKIARINDFKEEERIIQFVSSYNRILSGILSNKKLTAKQKLILSQSWSISLLEYLIEAVNMNSKYIPKTFIFFINSENDVENAKSKYWSIINLSDILNYLFENEKLKKETIGEFWGIVRLNLRNLEDDDNAKAAIMKISNIFFNIGLEIQKSGKTLSNQMLVNYIEIYEEIEYCIKLSSKKENKISDATISEWRNMLSELDSYEKFKEKLKW